jgi:hypothetical protein
VRETREAFQALLDLVRDSDAVFLEGPRAVKDEVSILEGYRWLTEVLSVALECYLWADADRPTFVEIVGPTRKFGGDNADAYYSFAPLDPRRTYRVVGRKGDACYLSLCVYGGPTDGRWSDRIVSALNDRQMTFAPDGTFELVLSPDPHPGSWLRLDPDTVCVVTRDYLVDPARGRKATWTIVAEPPASPPALLDDATLARRLRAAANFVRDLLAITPLSLDGLEANVLQDPYPVPQVTYGWAAPDAVYALGRYELGEDEALVVEGRSPRCAFWNLCLWNPYLQTYDYRYERVTINGGQVTHAPDGSWRLVVAARDPGTPNWLSTAGHRRGVLWFRWFLAEGLPPRPQTRVVSLAELRR